MSQPKKRLSHNEGYAKSSNRVTGSKEILIKQHRMNDKRDKVQLKQRIIGSTAARALDL